MGLADVLLQQSMQPQNTGYMNSFNQGQQQAYGRGLSGALASGAPRAEVMQRASYVDPMGVLKMQEANSDQDVTKRKIRELEQLWKDANRSLTQAKAVGDAQGISLYEGLITKLTGQLESLAPETWSGFGGETPVETGLAVTPRDTKPAIDAKYQELSEVLQGENLNFPTIKADLSRWGLEKGIATTNPDYKVLKDLISNVEQAGEKKSKKAIEAQKIKHSQGLAERRFTQAEEQDATKLDAEYKWLVGPLDNLDKDPNNTSYKLDALMTALRKESGAAIGADEFIQFMKVNLAGADLDRFNEETTGLKATVISMLNDDVRENYLKQIANNYLSKVSSDKIKKKLSDKIPTSYLDGRVKQKPQAKVAGTATDTENTRSSEPFNMDLFAETLKGRGR